jgi:hypothetical protein
MRGKLPPRLQIYMRSAVWYGAHGQVVSSFGIYSGPSPKPRNYRRARFVDRSPGAVFVIPGPRALRCAS